MQKTYFSKFIKEANIIYGFFTRQNGFSKNKYKTLNCSYAVGDKKNDVDKNINLIKKKIGLEKSKLKFMNQIHSNKVSIINKKNFSNKIESDGSITFDKNISLAVLTADCCPVFIYDKNSSFICCLHAGWKGCLSNIINTTSKIINKKNLNKNKIYAVVGPCIGKKNFEVDIKLRKKFIKKNSNYDKFFKKIKNEKYLFDIRALINFQLKNALIKNINNFNIDTYKNERLFFSYRRSTHKSTLPTGRMINIIGFL